MDPLSRIVAKTPERSAGACSSARSLAGSLLTPAASYRRLAGEIALDLADTAADHVRVGDDMAGRADAKPVPDPPPLPDLGLPGAFAASFFAAATFGAVNWPERC